MTIVEYILDPQDKPRSYHPKTIPSFISDGGYFVNPDGEMMIGIVESDDDVPDGIATFTLAELQARQRAIHAETPMKKEWWHESDDMTDDEVNAVIKEWVDARS
tara:strand:+ start:244 stop:555 length:312 start_codon:yes stop_codon:yes gene_type:complete